MKHKRKQNLFTCNIRTYLHTHLYIDTVKIQNKGVYRTRSNYPNGQK